MTGYGRGERARAGFKITVELGAVNRRQSEISTSLPREMETLEAPVRDVINARVARGRVTARIAVHAANGRSSAHAHINGPLAKAYAVELARLAKRLKIPGELTLEQVLRAPGVFQSDEELVEAEKIWPALERALKQALDALVKMREREGAHLERDLAARINLMRKAVGHIQKQAPRTAENYRKQLLERLKSAGLEHIAPDDERLLKEIVLFADRSDISEELTRLQSHFRQFEDCRRSSHPVGRTLDFLAQEMNREINTIGSKANDAVIAREIVTLKAELERFREQAQNVE
ncbi:MAG: YicC family protein [Verrucomicrobiota bacterium]|nr:YicC family protein [Verrucomicrobiota bacterium]